MTKDNDKKLDQQDPDELKSAGENKGKHQYKDASGTDPERYENSETDEDDRVRNFGKKPKNHTTTNERMINPDRGEK